MARITKPLTVQLKGNLNSVTIDQDTQTYNTTIPRPF